MTYPGGKNGAGVYQTLINLMPPHERYIEPFLGSGAILRLKRPARENIGIDLDPAAIAAFAGTTRFHVSGLPGAIVTSTDTSSSDDTGSRSGALVQSGDTAGSHSSPNPAMDAAIVIHGDGIRYLRERRYEIGPETLVYCDPPYLLSTRRSGPLYRYEMTRDQHIELLDTLLSLRCNVLLSGYWSELYHEMLVLGPEAPWSQTSFFAMTRGGTLAEEHIWANYPLPPAELHDYRFLGKNFRERERIKRKKARWQERLAKMPVLERYALLAALQSH